MTVTARVGYPAPDFKLPCAEARDENRRSIKLGDHAGRWLALMFYPRDFSFVCPTELTSFSARCLDFAHRNCDLLGISVDPVALHWEWLRTPPADGGLGPMQFPLASDPDGRVCRDYGVWDQEKQVATRGLFLIDLEGILQYTVIHNLNVGRSPDEVLRVLDALQTGGLCAASWTRADGTIDPERALKPGRILGHYRIRHRLGGGTFGTVFAAWDLRLERMVALKVLKRNVLESRDAILAEARAAARVDHPQVCTVYSVAEQDGLPLIAMQYLEGRTLEGLIEQGLSRDAADMLARQIAMGLVAAHSQQVVHGDLKPANVIVGHDGNASILDFGLAGQLHAPVDVTENVAEQSTVAAFGDFANEPDPDETLADHTMEAAGPCGVTGTPAYMSPEQAAGKCPTVASDVFTFGLIWFEMLTGRSALSADSLVRLLRRLRSEDLAPELMTQIPAADRPLLAGMLQRDPDLRPSMDQVLDRLPAGAPTITRSAAPGIES